MDYEKAYKEALKRAKQGLPMDEVFPELKESEDERIRKWLIEIVEELRKANPTNVEHNGNCSEAIAYLEKQKEYVSDNFDDVWTTEDCAEIIEAGEKLSPRFKELLKEVCNAWYDKGIELEKQKEAQPGDEGCYMEGYTSGMNDALKGHKNNIELIQRSWYLEGYHDGKFGNEPKWIIKTGEGGPKYEENPQYWPNLSNCIKDCKKCQGKCFYRKEMYQEQENVSERDEDKPHVEDILSLLNFGHSAHSKKEIDTWIKSLPERLNIKPVECIEFDNEFKNQVSHLLASVLCKEWEYNKGFVEYAAQQLLGYAKHEINPAEWSEEDENHFKHILNILEDEQGEQMEKGFNNLNSDICWFESLRLRTQPKQEWSEEDRQMLRNCVDALREGGNGNAIVINYNKHENWLEELPKRFNLEPIQEWSEEDENALEFLHELISFGFTKNFFDAQTATDMRKWLNTRLKSLRPQSHWKPSEEQMNAFFLAIKCFEEKGADGSVLHSLFRYLKKLM